MSRAAITKRQRASRACDFCHARGLRCRPAPLDDTNGPDLSCRTCLDYGVRCTVNRTMKKRGRKPKPVSADPRDDGDTGRTDTHSSALIQRLVRIYRDTMYQCYFPFLPERDLSHRWANGMPDPSEPSYLVLMALCAVSANTAELGAVFDQSLLEDFIIPASEEFFHRAITWIPSRLPLAQDFDYLRAYGLLTVYSLQRGNHSDLHRYLGQYHSLVAQYGFHDESRWPADISMSEVDDRRRLFWCAYRLEIHSSCVFGHMVRMPEAQISVAYPRTTPAMDIETQAWTVGWDYITDLFRFLEHAIFNLRPCGKDQNRVGLAMFRTRSSPTALLDSLTLIKENKPRILARVSNESGYFGTDRCRYMAVQISCTETLATIMALLYCQAPACEVTDIAEKFLDELTKAPLIMFKVASNQIIHQLLGVGHMLSNASRHDNGQYRSETRRLLSFLGDLVKGLEDVIPSAAAAGERLLMLTDAIS